jgi:hypothetical protein
MIKVNLSCEMCGARIADGISANEVRFQAKALYRRRKGKDLCLACESAARRSRRRATGLRSDLLRRA